MDQLLFHPKLVHLPIALAVLLPLVSGGVLFGWWRGWFDRRVWVLVFLLQAALVGSGALAMKTGEQEEERVERVVAEEKIEAHEEAAEIFVWAGAALLLLMAVPLVLPDSRARQVVALGAVLGTLVISGLGYAVGEAGGKLVYQYGAAQVYVENGEISGGTVAGDDSDDSDSH
ncbi:MAG: DUF2231 domain-containing protein [Polyangiales bacterium]